MRGGFRALSVFLLATLWLVPLSPTVVEARDRSYVSSTQLPPQLLPPPPAEGDAAWRVQVDAVLAAQKHIPDADIAAMRDEQHMRLSLMTDVMGADFTRDRLPKTYALLDRVLADANDVTDADKTFWHTRRPYLTDAHVKLLVDPIDKSPAYPSGHTSETRVRAEVLGLLSPDHLAALRAHAEVIAAHRVEAGVHHPNDLEGGRLLAMLIVGALIENADFQTDLAAARAEIAERK